MNKKLDTIHIHGMNAMIAIGIVFIFIFSRRDSYISPIMALSIDQEANNKKYEEIKLDLDNKDKSQHVSPISIDTSSLENKIVGVSAIIYDATDGQILWSQESNKTSSLASLTKVMTAYIYKSNCDKPILFSGLKWESDDALRYMLIESSNEMAKALSHNCVTEREFVAEMNTKAEKLKLNLHYTNASGLDSYGIIGGRGDAISTAKLFYRASSEYPGVFDYTTYRYSNIQVHNAYDDKISSYVQAINTNQYIDRIEGARMSKTGLTDYAGGNLGIVYDPYMGKSLVLLVLGSTKEGRFGDINIMYKSISVKQ